MAAREDTCRQYAMLLSDSVGCLGHKLLQQIYQNDFAPPPASTDEAQLPKKAVEPHTNVPTQSTPSGDTIFSPLLLHSLLTMALMGARGKTRTQIANLLMQESAPGSLSCEENAKDRRTDTKPNCEQQLQKSYELFVSQWIASTLTKIDSSSTQETTAHLARAFDVRIEHSVLHAEPDDEDPCPLENSWRSSVYRTFNAPMMAAPFRHFPELIGDKPAIQVMHEMTSNPTAGMIRHILPGIPPHDTLVMILNALHARGHWIKDGTANKDTNVVEIADEKVEVNRPSDQQHKTPFFQSSAIRATLSCFPLCNSEADDIHSSLLVVTPDADVCCDDQAVAAWLSSFEWKQLRQEIAQLEAGGTSDVPVALPRFTLERHLELKNVLELLGLQSYFDSRSADFGYLTARSGVSFAQMTHKAKLMVSADGVEAAAAGATLMSGPAFLPDGRPRSSTARKPSSRINQQQSGDSLRHRGPAYVVLFYAIPGFAPGHSIPLFFGLFGRRCEHGSFLPSDAAHEHVLRDPHERFRRPRPASAQ